MKAVEGKKIAIVGGGPGGLTLARLLQQSGAQVPCMSLTRAALRAQGSALDLHEGSGLAALEAAGLTDAFRAITGLTLIVSASPMLADGFFTIIRTGCPVPEAVGDRARTATRACAQLALTWHGGMGLQARFGGDAGRAGSCVLRVERRHWPA